MGLDKENWMLLKTALVSIIEVIDKNACYPGLREANAIHALLKEHVNVMERSLEKS